MAETGKEIGKHKSVLMLYQPFIPDNKKIYRDEIINRPLVYYIDLLGRTIFEGSGTEFLTWVDIYYAESYDKQMGLRKNWPIPVQFYLGLPFAGDEENYKYFISRNKPI